MRIIDEIKADLAKPCDYTDKCELTAEFILAVTADLHNNLDRLEEICTAERDGRCVVLPCKVGTRVWFVDNGKIDNGVVKWFDTGHPDNPRWTVAVQDAPRGPRFLPLEAIKLTPEEAEAALAKEDNDERE